MKIKPLQTHTIITIQRPLLWFFSAVLIVSIVLISLWISFEYGRSTAGYDSSSADVYIEQLKAQLEESQAEIVETHRQATMLERNSLIDKDASSELKETLVKAQDEVLELKKELSFYKSIVAPEKGDRSIAIQTIQLRKNEAGDYYYKVMLSQRGRNNLFAKGTVKVRIKGTSKGKDVILALTDVSKDVKEPMKFGFKYFQNFEGVMNLPAAFQPDYLQVVVNPSTGKLKAIDEQFAWSDLTAGGV
jgi:cellobiose-specific phosphotransferase system component IIA